MKELLESTSTKFNVETAALGTENIMKKVISIILSAVMIISFSSCSSSKQKANLSQWKSDGAINKITEYVEAVTDEKNSDFIPENDRIAVFDLDGTLICEQYPIYFEWFMFAHRVFDDPDFTPTDEMTDTAGSILYAAKAKSISEDIEEKESQLFGKAFDGMTTEEYDSYVRNFLEQDADGFENLKFCEAYFRPMAALVDYLEENNFMVYICSGTDRNADRIMLSYFTDVPNYRVIGSDYYTEGSMHDEEYYLDYQFDADEKIIRDDVRIIKNVKSAKVVQMSQEIGQKPVLAFGNSSGDVSMFRYVTDGNKYRSAAFCLLPDDDEREYAYPAKAESLTDKCNENGWFTISMKDDFLTMFGDNVVKNPDSTPTLDRLIGIYESRKK